MELKCDNLILIIDLFLVGLIIIKEKNIKCSLIDIITSSLYLTQFCKNWKFFCVSYEKIISEIDSDNAINQN